MTIETIVIVAAVVVFGHFIVVGFWLFFKIRRNAERDRARREKQNH